MSQSPVDEEVLDELKDMLEDEFIDLLQTYLKDTASKLELLKQSLSSGTLEEVRKLAHSVKGSSVNLGIAPLSALCGELEVVAQEGDISRCQSLLMSILNEAETVFGLLKAKLD